MLSLPKRASLFGLGKRHGLCASIESMTSGNLSGHVDVLAHAAATKIALKAHAHHGFIAVVVWCLSKIENDLK